MDDEHRRERPLPRRRHEVAADRLGVAARRRVAHVLRLDARVGKRDRLRARVVRHQAVRHRKGAGAERAGALEELAPVDAAVAVLVVEREDLPVDVNLGDGHAVSPPRDVRESYRTKKESL